MSQKPNTVAPAVCLIITGVFNAMLGLLGVVSGIMQIINPSDTPISESEAERFGYYTGQSIGLVAFLLSFVAAPMIIFGAVKMLNGTSYNWAKTASILATIPFTSCCFLIGAPIGIWAMIVLSKPEVKMFFGRGGANVQPPAPPQYY
jgi:hypothetical protein